jgi:hypothetical protein
MWEPRRLTILWAAKVCYKDSFAFLLPSAKCWDNIQIRHNCLFNNLSNYFLIKSSGHWCYTIWDTDSVVKQITNDYNIFLGNENWVTIQISISKWFQYSNPVPRFHFPPFNPYYWLILLHHEQWLHTRNINLICIYIYIYIYIRYSKNNATNLKYCNYVNYYLKKI